MLRRKGVRQGVAGIAVARFGEDLQHALQENASGKGAYGFLQFFDTIDEFVLGGSSTPQIEKEIRDAIRQIYDMSEVLDRIESDKSYGSIETHCE